MQPAMRTALAFFLGVIVLWPSLGGAQDMYDQQGRRIPSQAPFANNPSGTPVPLNTNGSGALKVEATMSGGGDASADNQETQISAEQAMQAILTAMNTGTVRTWTLQTGVTSGSTIAAGAISISIVPSSDFAGTINGATITGATNGSAFSPKVIPPDTLPAVIYTRSAGSLTISVLR